MQDNFFVLKSEEVNITDLGINFRFELYLKVISILQHFILINYSEGYLICYIRIL